MAGKEMPDAASSPGAPCSRGPGLCPDARWWAGASGDGWTTRHTDEAPDVNDSCGTLAVV